VHTFLNELSNVAPGARIKVRIAHMWNTLNITEKEMISTDMVLIDEKVFVMALIILLFLHK
jgi:hypothetical protein